MVEPWVCGHSAFGSHRARCMAKQQIAQAHARSSHAPCPKQRPGALIAAGGALLEHMKDKLYSKNKCICVCECVKGRGWIMRETFCSSWVGWIWQEPVEERGVVGYVLDQRPSDTVNAWEVRTGMQPQGQTWSREEEYWHQNQKTYKGCERWMLNAPCCKNHDQPTAPSVQQKSDLVWEGERNQPARLRGSGQIQAVNNRWCWGDLYHEILLNYLRYRVGADSNK